jgi:hypothetical protein
MQRETTCRAPDCPGCEPADIGDDVNWCSCSTPCPYGECRLCGPVPECEIASDGVCDGCFVLCQSEAGQQQPQQRREEEVPFG